MRDRLALAAAAASILLVLAGCAPERDRSWSPEQWPVYGEVLDDVPQPSPPDASTVGQRLRNDTVRIDARWAYLPGTHPVNEAVAQVVRGAVASQAAASGTAYRPQAFPAGAGLGDRGCDQGSTTRPAAELLGSFAEVHTVVVCEIVAAEGTVFGQRLRVITGSPTGVLSDAMTVIYTDIATGEVASARQLFGDIEALWADVVEVLRRDAGSLSIRPPGAPTAGELAQLDTMLASATFGADELILTLPIGFAAAPLAGLANVPASTAERPVFVSLSAAVVVPALTPLGQAVMNAAGPFAAATAAAPGFDRVDCDLMPCMALTLDDGPSPGLTSGMLDVLRDEHAAATFYMLGQEAQRYPDIVRRVAAEGHQVGNHTWNHPYLTTLDDAQIQSQLGRTGQLLRDLSGQPVATFRPPGGFIDARVMAAAGQTAVMWSVDTRDWAAGRDDASLLTYAVDAPVPSTIMLMHDIQPVTARIFPEIVRGLHDRGFALVTVDALFGGRPPPGIVRNGP